ncbi:MAG: hypothetical protein P0116_02400 [Candidatus Nitrosocosmicus sp.]|nr:hypothetical protein [Candidatus Nitrosocosmicus sp.]
MKKKFTLSADIPNGIKKDGSNHKDENNIEILKEVAEDNCGCNCSCGDSELQTPSSSLSSIETMMENSFEKQQNAKRKEQEKKTKSKNTHPHRIDTNYSSSNSRITKIL